MGLLHRRHGFLPAAAAARFALPITATTALGVDGRYVCHGCPYLRLLGLPLLCWCARFALVVTRFVMAGCCLCARPWLAVASVWQAVAPSGRMWLPASRLAWLQSAVAWPWGTYY